MLDNLDVLQYSVSLLHFCRTITGYPSAKYLLSDIGAPPAPIYLQVTLFTDCAKSPLSPPLAPSSPHPPPPPLCPTSTNVVEQPTSFQEVVRWSENYPMSSLSMWGREAVYSLERSSACGQFLARSFIRRLD